VVVGGIFARRGIPRRLLASLLDISMTRLVRVNLTLPSHGEEAGRRLSGLALIRPHSNLCVLLEAQMLVEGVDSNSATEVLELANVLLSHYCCLVLFT
jgi:hypothetical protein